MIHSNTMLLGEIRKHTASLLFAAVVIMMQCSLVSCNRPFSEYEKKDPTDAEIAGFKGKVKQVDRYHKGELKTTKFFNEYGFIEKEIEFSDGKIFGTTTYTYNKWGKVEMREVDNKCVHEIYTYEYDKKGNELKCVKELLELRDTLYYDKVKKCVVYRNELEYDKSGTLVSVAKYVGGVLEEKRVYDAMGRLKKDYHKYAGDSLYLGIGEYYYDSCSVMKLSIYKEFSGDSLTSIASDIYDSNGAMVQRVIKVPSNENAGDTITTILVRENDSHGNFVTQKTNIYDSKGMNYGSGAWDDGRVYEYEYDKMGNIIKCREKVADEICYTNVISYYE